MTSGDSVSGGVKTLLRAEGLVVWLFSLVAYQTFGAGWGLFALCFLLPDLSLLGYVAGPGFGALLYNVAHSYVGPLLCLGLGMFLLVPVLITVGIIWIAHIGFDRALGYGLKYERGFRFTHLGLIGRTKA